MPHCLCILINLAYGVFTVMEKYNGEICTCRSSEEELQYVALLPISWVSSTEIFQFIYLVQYMFFFFNELVY